MKSLALICLLAACGDNSIIKMPPPQSPAIVSFDLTSAHATPDTFFDFPFPSDLRLTADGKPDLRGYPNPNPSQSVEQLRTTASQRAGFPVIPVSWFHFSAAPPTQIETTTIAAKSDSPILLIDLDPGVTAQQRLLPTVAQTLVTDSWLPDNVLAIAPHPGIVLRGKRLYAFVVMRSLEDASGQTLAVPPALTALVSDTTSAAGKLYAPLWPALTGLGLDPANVAAATVFTTSDVVADTAALSDAMKAKYTATITHLGLAPMGDTYDRYCYLQGTIKFPQFQNGVPPFGKGGVFEFTDNGLPAKQGDLEVPITITLPKSAMPVGGYPLLIYFHGSGGLSTDVVDFGPRLVAGGDFQPRLGPAYVVAPFGLATASSALPLNPERFANASAYEYLNINNLSAMRDTFRQGVIEQRLYLETLRTLTIAQSLLGACQGPTLPASETNYHFNPSHLVAEGHSMGAMYTNMVSAVEPRIQAALPMGAGGFWSHMMLESKSIQGGRVLIGALLGTDAELSFLHPGLHLFEMAWEPIDPYVYTPRLARDPLPGAAPRPIYQPAGKDDIYFPTDLYDAMAGGYGHQQVGDIQWPTMQDTLTLEGLGGILPYPVKQNRMSMAGTPYTGVVVQYLGDGLADPHDIFAQLDSVKYQYGCFLGSFLATGIATVPAPAALGTPCPQ